MLRSMAPLHSLEGCLLVRVCEGNACAMAPVALSAYVYADGSAVLTYWDPEDHDNAQTVTCETRCESEALTRMLTAIASVALAPSQP